MTFDPTKPVATKKGEPARILCTDLSGDQPIAAAVRSPYGETVYQFSAGGHFLLKPGSLNDLINVDEFARPGREILPTREGGRAWVVTRDGPNPHYPIVGVIEGSRTVTFWNAAGKVIAGEANGSDLILSEAA